MEKLVFLFRRKPGATREAYFAHYLTNHSPLGLKYKQGLAAYTVNPLLSPAEFDVVTEIWTPSALAFLGPETNQGEGAAEIMADHLGFMGPQDAYAVAERVVKDGALTSPTGTQTPGVKAVSFHRRGEPLPEPAAGALRVVDNAVLRPLVLGDQGVDDEIAAAHDLAVIRTSWAASEADLGPLAADTVLVREFRLRLMEPA